MPHLHFTIGYAVAALLTANAIGLLIWAALVECYERRGEVSRGTGHRAELRCSSEIRPEPGITARGSARFPARFVQLWTAEEIEMEGGHEWPHGRSASAPVPTATRKVASGETSPGSSVRAARDAGS